jgi:tetrathionate reductase subunit B
MKSSRPTNPPPAEPNGLSPSESSAKPAQPMPPAPGGSSITRRELVQIGGAALCTVAVGSLVNTHLAKGAAMSSQPGRMAMLIDLRRCFGCQACSIACKSENGVLLGNFRSWVSQSYKGKYPKVRRHFLPRTCNHCEKPACVKVCPVGASFKRDDGTVLIDKTICIGCRYCMSACPYGVRSFVWKRLPDREMSYPSRVTGVVDKCDFCVHRLDKGLVPSCVNTCPAGARIVGDLSDPNSEISRAMADQPVQTLAPELGTQPNVYYIGLDKDAAEASLESGVRVIPVQTTNVTKLELK